MLKLAISATLVTSPFLHCFEQFGWHTVDGSVQTTWDNNEECMEEEAYAIVKRSQMKRAGQM